MSYSPEQHVRRARELIAQYSYTQALSEAETALGGLERAADRTSIQYDAYYLAGTAAFHLAEYSLAQEYMNHAAEGFTATNEMERAAECQVLLAECSARRGDVRRAKHMAHQIVEQSQREGWRHITARALTCLGTAAWREGDNQEALSLLEQAIALHLEANAAHFAYLVRISAAVALIKAARFAEASALLEECLQFFLVQNDSLHAVHCLNNLAGIAFQTGDLERAREYILHCTELQAELHHRGELLVSWYNLGLVEARLGNTKLARKYLHRSYQVAQEVGDRVAEGSALLQLGLVALHEGQAEEALNFAALARVPLNNAPAPQMGFLAAHLPVINLACGHTETALELWSALPPIEDPETLASVRESLALLQDDTHPLQQKLSGRERQIAKDWVAELS